MKKHSMMKAKKAAATKAAADTKGTAADTAGSASGTVDDTGNLDWKKEEQKSAATPGTGSAASGTVDDTGNVDKSAPAVDQGKAVAPSTSAGTEGD